MQELFIILSGSLSWDQAIDMLEEATKEFRLAPTEENREKLNYHCLIITTKTNIDKCGSTEQLIKDVHKAQKGNKLLTTLES